jgi:hypothetical protein
MQGKGKPAIEKDFGQFTFEDEDKDTVNRDLKKWTET